MEGNPTRAAVARFRGEQGDATLLQTAIRIIATSLNLNELLEVIAKLIAEATGGDSCLIYLFDDKREELVLRGAKNPHPRLLGKIKMKLGEGITGWVAQHREPVAVPRRAGEDPRFKFFHHLTEDRYEAFLSVPVLLRDRPGKSNEPDLIGVLNVQHKAAHKYSPREISVLESISDLVAGAIEKARLKEEAAAAREELAARKIIERAKGLLMKRDRLTEEEAFRLLRKTAMDRRRTMKEVAEAVLLAEDLRK